MKEFSHMTVSLDFAKLLYVRDKLARHVNTGDDDLKETVDEIIETLLILGTEETPSPHEGGSKEWDEEQNNVGNKFRSDLESKSKGPQTSGFPASALKTSKWEAKTQEHQDHNERDQLMITRGRKKQFAIDSKFQPNESPQLTAKQGKGSKGAANEPETAGNLRRPPKGPNPDSEKLDVLVEEIVTRSIEKKYYVVKDENGPEEGRYRLVAEVPISGTTKSALKAFQDQNLIRTIDGRESPSSKTKKYKQTIKLSEKKSTSKKKVKSTKKSGQDGSYDGETFPLHHYTKDIVQNGKFDNSFEEWLFAPIIANNPVLAEKMRKTQQKDQTKSGKKRNLSLMLSDDEQVPKPEKKKTGRSDLEPKSRTEQKKKPIQVLPKADDSMELLPPKQLIPPPGSHRLGAGDRDMRQLTPNRYDSEGDGSASISARGNSRGYLGRPENNYFSGVDEGESARSTRVVPVSNSSGQQSRPNPEKQTSDASAPAVPIAWQGNAPSSEPAKQDGSNLKDHTSSKKEPDLESALKHQSTPDVQQPGPEQKQTPGLSSEDRTEQPMIQQADSANPSVQNADASVGQAVRDPPQSEGTSSQPVTASRQADEGSAHPPEKTTPPQTAASPQQEPKSVVAAKEDAGDSYFDESNERDQANKAHKETLENDTPNQQVSTTAEVPSRFKDNPFLNKQSAPNAIRQEAVPAKSNHQPSGSISGTNTESPLKNNPFLAKQQQGPQSVLPNKQTESQIPEQSAPSGLKSNPFLQRQNQPQGPASLNSGPKPAIVPAKAPTNPDTSKPAAPSVTKPAAPTPAQSAADNSNKENTESTPSPLKNNPFLAKQQAQSQPIPMASKDPKQPQTEGSPPKTSALKGNPFLKPKEAPTPPAPVAKNVTVPAENPPVKEGASGVAALRSAFK